MLVRDTGIESVGQPAYDAHRRLMRPCLHPVVLGMEPLDNRGCGWPARDAA